MLPTWLNSVSLFQSLDIISIFPDHEPHTNALTISEVLQLMLPHKIRVIAFRSVEHGLPVSIVQDESATLLQNHRRRTSISCISSRPVEYTHHLLSVSQSAMVIQVSRETGRSSGCCGCCVSKSSQRVLRTDTSTQLQVDPFLSYAAGTRHFKCTIWDYTSHRTEANSQGLSPSFFILVVLSIKRWLLMVPSDILDRIQYGEKYKSLNNIGKE